MLPLQHRTVGKAGVEPAVSCSQGTRGTRSSSSRFSFHFSDPCGIRTQPLQLERLTTSPEVERAILLRARTLSAVGREALESSSAAFQATADQPAVGARVSATDPCFAACIPATTSTSGQQKKPDVFVTPGFVSHSRPWYGQASQAQRMRRGILSGQQRIPIGEQRGSARGITLRYAFLDRTWS